MSGRLVMLGVDGLDWKLLRAGAQAGRLPQLADLLRTAAHAKVAVRACVPELGGAEEGLNSPTLWTTIATGQYYFQHGVYDFCNLLASTDNPPFFQSGHVRSPRIWDVLSQHDLTSLVVGYYVTHPAYRINGVMVDDLFGEVERTNVCWPPQRCDELARVLGAADYPDYFHKFGVLGTESGVRAAREESPLNQVARPMARDVLTRFTELDQEQIEALLDAPEDQQRRKLLEYRLIYPYVRDDRFQRLFLHLLDNESFDFATVYYRLLDFVSHGFWGDGLKLSEGFVKIFGDTLMRAYEWIDGCIGQVRRRLRDDDCLLVLSDHGFAANRELPDLAACEDISEFSYGHHAEPAVLFAAGGAKTGPTDNVSLLDVAPSILDYFGLAQADTLDGGVVPQLLHADAPRDLARVAAYPYTAPPPGGDMSASEQQQVRRRLAALGYLET